MVTVELTGELGTLGEDSKCSSEPQSLIAEYFISCEPAGPPIAEDDDADDPVADIPASQVAQTVQNDLVQNTLREPFRERLTLLINEFGTALAGNPDSLNEAIRLGAPALTDLRKVTRILASQNTIIRDLNANSDQVIGRLAERREDVVRFIQEARDTAETAAGRREDLSRDFELLDDFLAELRPTLVELDNLAVEQTPLLTDLRAAAPGLTRLATNLPGFNDATRVALAGLGEASVVGEQALRRGRDEIEQLAEAGRKAPLTAEILADFLRDLDDPRRAVEIDDRVTPDTGRTDPRRASPTPRATPGSRASSTTPTTRPARSTSTTRSATSSTSASTTCSPARAGHFDTGRDPQTGDPGVPAEDGGTTTDILEADNCVSWLGPNQPGINEDLNLPKYDPSVCPNGTEPPAAEQELCSPADPPSSRARAGGASASGGRGEGSGGAPEPAAPAPGDGSGDGSGGGGAPSGGGSSGGGPPIDLPGLPGGGGGAGDILDQILDLPPDVLDELPGDLQDQLGGGGQAPLDPGATTDLLDFLMGS